MKRILLIIVWGAAVSGCTSYESAQNSHQAREYLTEDIEDQVVFNLIRASNGLPFAHYDVSTVQSVVSAKVAPSLGGSRSGVTNGFQPAAVVTSAIRTITRTITPGLNAERNNAVTVNIQPVFDEPRVYASYVKFLNLPSKPKPERLDEPVTRLVSPEPTPSMVDVSEKKTNISKLDKDQKPTESTVQVETSKEMRTPGSPTPQIDFARTIHSIVGKKEKPAKELYIPRTLRKWNDLWYYVPAQYKPEFSDLCFSLVARGDSAAPGGAKKKDNTTKELQQFRDQLIQQNSLHPGN